MSDITTWDSAPETFPPYPHLPPDAAGILDGWLEATRVEPVSAREWQCTAAWAQWPRQVSDAMWFQITAGTGHCWVGRPDRRFHLRPGDLFLIPQGMPHAVFPDPGVCFHQYTVHFFARIYTTLDLLTVLGLAGVFPSATEAPYAHVSAELAREYALRAPGWRTGMATRIMHVLLHIIRHHGDALCLPGDSTLHRDLLRLLPVLDYIDRHLHEPALRVDDLARQIFVSEVYLRKLFHRVTQSGPVEYLRRRRIDRACTLLRSTDAGITEIAEQCGFADLPFFYKTFKQATAATPARYRAQMEI